MVQYTEDLINYSQFRDLPGAVYTRSGVAYQQNASGTWVPFDADVPPISDGVGLGVWEARTNSVRNPTPQGAVVGVLGSGGSLPTNWAKEAEAALTMTVLGTGTENGLPYVDIRVNGTPTQTFFNVLFEIYTQVVAANGETWTAQLFAKQIAGSLSGLSTWLSIFERTAAGSYVAGGLDLSMPLTGTLTGVSKARTLGGGATVARVNSAITFTFAAGTPIDVSFRIAAPNLKLGADIGDPPILQTNNAAATRGAPTAYLNAPGLLVPPFTVQVWAQLPALDGVARVLLNLGDGTASNRLYVERSSSNAATLSRAGGSGGLPASFAGKTGARLLKTAFRIRSTELAFACDGASPNSVSGVTQPVMTTIFPGWTGGSTFLNGDLTRLQIINRDVTDAELQALTA